MNSDITGIDHLMLAVSDGDAAGAVFARMGFTITPRGRLPGLSNRLICFANPRGNVPNFVELMSLEDPRIAPPAMAEALDVSDRPVLMVAASADAGATRERLSGAGLEVSPVIEGARDWTLGDGRVVELAFSILLPAVGQAPFYWIACQHKTPQHYLRADFTRHDNRAMELGGIIAVARAPLAAARHYREFWGAEIVEPAPAGGPVIVRCGPVRLHVHSHESLARACPGIAPARPRDHIAGFVVRVREAADLFETLRGNGFRPLRVGSQIVLDPSQACGCLVVFEPACGDGAERAAPGRCR